jgi:hypothetical protein
MTYGRETRDTKKAVRERVNKLVGLKTFSLLVTVSDRSTWGRPGG